MTEKTTTSKKWSDENVATLLATVGDQSPVSADKVNAAAEKLQISVRSVASKLRQLDREVDSLAKERVSTFSVEEGTQLAEFVNSRAGELTYKEISEQFMDGNFSPKQIQGKLLALELTSSVKAAPKVEAARVYTPEQEETFVKLANEGKFIEDIAQALGKEITSVRGKALSLNRNGQIKEIPKQRESHANTAVDPVEKLGEKLGTMTVAEIATATDKTERGIKTLLTRRGIKVADYDGASKKQKAEAKATA